MKVGVVGNWRKAQPNKKLKALALLAGTLTRGATSLLCPTCQRPLFKNYEPRLAP